MEVEVTYCCGGASQIIMLTEADNVSPPIGCDKFSAEDYAHKVSEVGIAIKTISDDNLREEVQFISPHCICAINVSCPCQ